MAAELPLAGMLFRPRYHDDIFAARGVVDVVEIVVDDYLEETPEQFAQLRSLVRTFTVIPHALESSFASADGVDEAYLRRVARIVARTGCAWWGDHLAFTRAGGRRLGALAPPQRTREQVEVVARNVARANAIVGVPLVLENVASLAELPGATMDEATFLRAILDSVDCDLLLDLHNVYANATNFGDDAAALIDALPPDRIREVHLAGGYRRDGVVVDSHTAPVPEAVWTLLDRLLARACPAAIVIEREEPLPPFADALADVTRLRHAVATRTRAA